MNLEDHISKSSERYKRTQEFIEQQKREEEIEGQRLKRVKISNYAEEMSRLVEEIGYREYFVYRGKRIRFFGSDYTVRVREWSTHEHSGWTGGNPATGLGQHWSSTHFTFKGRTTSEVEEIRWGHYFPALDISIHSTFMTDINDYNYLKERLNGIKVLTSEEHEFSKYESASDILQEPLWEIYLSSLHSESNKRKVNHIMKRFGLRDQLSK